MSRISKFNRQTLHSKVPAVYINGDGVIYCAHPRKLIIYTSEFKRISTMLTEDRASHVCDDVELAYSVSNKMHVDDSAIQFAGHIDEIIYHPYRRAYIVRTDQSEISMYDTSVSYVVTGFASVAYSVVATEYSSNIYFLDNRSSSLEITNGDRMLTSGQLVIRQITCPEDPWIMRLSSIPNTPDWFTVMTARAIYRIDPWHTSAHIQTAVSAPSASHVFLGMVHISSNIMAATSAVSAYRRNSVINIYDIRYQMSQQIPIAHSVRGLPVWHATPSGISTLYAGIDGDILRII